MTSLLQVDNLDDRREVWRALAALPPADRWRFVRWCSESCLIGNHRPVFRLVAGDRERLREAEIGRGKADDGITGEAYGLLWSLSSQYGLDLDDVLGTLVAITRGRLTFADLHTRRPVIRPTAGVDS